MIRRHTVLTALALASAVLALGQPAQAGGGVRLNFGGPLGTFVATPTPGYGGGSGYATAKPKAYDAKRAAVAAERRKSKPARPVVQVRHSAPSNAAKAHTADHERKCRSRPARPHIGPRQPAPPRNGPRSLPDRVQSSPGMAMKRERQPPHRS